MENKCFKIPFSFSQEEVQKFAEVTGDRNPIHLDEEFAKETIFKKPILHGLLAASIFSKIFGTLHPGTGAIYLKQDLKFIAPMFVDTIYTAKIQVKAIIKEKSRAIVETTIENEEGNLTITGEAVIQHEIFK